MTIFKTRMKFIFLAILAAALPSPAATVVDFEYSFPALLDDPYAISVSAKGQLTLEPIDAGKQQIVGITGKRTVTTYYGFVFEADIVGLVAPGVFFGTNYLYYPAASGEPFLDLDGLAHLISPATYANYGDMVNVYYVNGTYTEYDEYVGTGAFKVTEPAGQATVPEPASAGVLLLGAVGMAVLSLGRRRKRF
jgi:hypothetical protein